MRASPAPELPFTPARAAPPSGFFQSGCYCCQSPAGGTPFSGSETTPLSKGAQYTLIANVPYDTVRQDLVVEFRKFGRVELAMVVCDEASRHPHKEWTSTAGYAFVRFSKRSEAAAAIQAASMGLITIRGARVRADWAKKDSYAKRGRVPPAQGAPTLNSAHVLPDGLVALHMLQQQSTSSTTWPQQPSSTRSLQRTPYDSAGSEMDDETQVSGLPSPSTTPMIQSSREFSDGLIALQMLQQQPQQASSSPKWPSGPKTVVKAADSVCADADDDQASGVLQTALQNALLDALASTPGVVPTSGAESQRRRRRNGDSKQQDSVCHQQGLSSQRRTSSTQVGTSSPATPVSTSHAGGLMSSVELNAAAHKGLTLSSPEPLKLPAHQLLTNSSSSLGVCSPFAPLSQPQGSLPSLPIKSKQTREKAVKQRSCDTQSSCSRAKGSVRTGSPVSSSGREKAAVSSDKGARTPETAVDSTCENSSSVRQTVSPGNYSLDDAACDEHELAEDDFGPLSPADLLPIDLLSPCSRGLLTTALRDVQAEDGRESGFTSDRCSSTVARRSPEELLRQALVDFSATCGADEWSPGGDFPPAKMIDHRTFPFTPSTTAADFCGGAAAPPSLSFHLGSAPPVANSFSSMISSPPPSAALPASHSPTNAVAPVPSRSSTPLAPTSVTGLSVTPLNSSPMSATPLSASLLLATELPTTSDAPFPVASIAELGQVPSSPILQLPTKMPVTSHAVQKMLASHSPTHELALQQQSLHETAEISMFGKYERKQDVMKRDLEQPEHEKRNSPSIDAVGAGTCLSSILASKLAPQSSNNVHLMELL